MSDLDLKALLTRTDAFIRTMHVVRDDFSLLPTKEHIATCVNYADLQEMRDDFVRELKNTILAFVYSPAKQQELVSTFEREGRDPGGAWSHLLEKARSKFRNKSLQGQFSELLLSNLLQHYFHAAPLLRKMKITTNPALERNGADAIHIAREGDDFLLYVGEAKTYNRKGSSLRAALVDAISDAVSKHYPNHRNELDLYSHEDFLPPELEQIAQGYLNGTLTNVEVHLVCMVTYDSKEPISGMKRDEILDCIIGQVKREAAAARTHKLFKEISPALLPRLNYVLFPVREMDELITLFQKKLGYDG